MIENVRQLDKKEPISSSERVLFENVASVILENYAEHVLIPLADNNSYAGFGIPSDFNKSNVFEQFMELAARTSESTNFARLENAFESTCFNLLGTGLFAMNAFIESSPVLQYMPSGEKNELNKALLSKLKKLGYDYKSVLKSTLNPEIRFFAKNFMNFLTDYSKIGKHNTFKKYGVFQNELSMTEQIKNHLPGFLFSSSMQSVLFGDNSPVSDSAEALRSMDVSVSKIVTTLQQIESKNKIPFKNINERNILETLKHAVAYLKSNSEYSMDEIKNVMENYFINSFKSSCGIMEQISFSFNSYYNKKTSVNMERENKSSAISAFVSLLESNDIRSGLEILERVMEHYQTNNSLYNHVPDKLVVSKFLSECDPLKPECLKYMKVALSMFNDSENVIGYIFGNSKTINSEKIKDSEISVLTRPIESRNEPINDFENTDRGKTIRSVLSDNKEVMNETSPDLSDEEKNRIYATAYENLEKFKGGIFFQPAINALKRYSEITGDDIMVIFCDLMKAQKTGDMETYKAISRYIANENENSQEFNKRFSEVFAGDDAVTIMISEMINNIRTNYLSSENIEEKNNSLINVTLRKELLGGLLQEKKNGNNSIGLSDFLHMASECAEDIGYDEAKEIIDAVIELHDFNFEKNTFGNFIMQDVFKTGMNQMKKHPLLKEIFEYSGLKEEHFKDLIVDTSKKDQSSLDILEKEKNFDRFVNSTKFGSMTGEEIMNNFHLIPDENIRNVVESFIRFIAGNEPVILNIAQEERNKIIEKLEKNTSYSKLILKISDPSEFDKFKEHIGFNQRVR